VPELFYEDLEPGRTFELGVVDVDEAEMIAFARRFDPQWYHVDAEAAKPGWPSAPSSPGRLRAAGSRVNGPVAP
jgi:acyl dehydratase